MRRILIATPLLALVAAACTGTGSYKDQTEDFLNDDARCPTPSAATSPTHHATSPTAPTSARPTSAPPKSKASDPSRSTCEINAEDSFLVTDFNF